MAGNTAQFSAPKGVFKDVDLSKMPVQGQGQNVGQTYRVPNPVIDHAAEASSVMFFLKTIRDKHRSIRDNGGSHDQHNAAQWLAECNDELLAFCNANKRKYTLEAGDRTMMIEKAREEDMKVIHHLEAKTTKLEMELKEALQAKERALNRLSEVHSRLLKLGNPEIADLSDENRPTNLGQKFKQLYEDDWTDAFEFLTDKKVNPVKDDKAIGMLYEMLKRCKDVCVEGQAAQQSSLAKLVTNPSLHQNRTVPVIPDTKPQPAQKPNIGKLQNVSVQPLHHQGSNPKKNDFSLTMPPGSRPGSGGGQSAGANQGNKFYNKNVQPGTKPASQMSDVYDAGQMSEPSKSTVDVKKIQGKFDVLFKEFSKGVADETLNHLPMTDILSAINKDDYFEHEIVQNAEVRKFLQNCFNICWLMLAQYPPMLMDFETKAGHTFDSSAFDPYTIKGPTIAQVVWPPVYLHKDGPLVCKGYAEGSKKQ